MVYSNYSFFSSGFLLLLLLSEKSCIKLSSSFHFLNTLEFIMYLLSSLFFFFVVNCNTDNELQLTPSNTEVVQVVNESYIVFCRAENSTVRWVDPKGAEVANNRSHRIHVEEHGERIALVFVETHSGDNGTWTCQANSYDKKISFKLAVHSKFG